MARGEMLGFRRDGRVPSLHLPLPWPKIMGHSIPDVTLGGDASMIAIEPLTQTDMRLLECCRKYFLLTPPVRQRIVDEKKTDSHLYTPPPRTVF